MKKKVNKFSIYINSKNFWFNYYIQIIFKIKFINIQKQNTFALL